MSDFWRMDPELKARWVAKLRSGDIKQAQGALRERTFTGFGEDRVCTGEAMCCLGVLLQVYKPDEWSEVSPNEFFHSGRMSDAEFISCRTLKEIGMTDALQHLFAKMNDGGDSFAKIADEIEKTVPTTEPTVVRHD